MMKNLTVEIVEMDTAHIVITEYDGEVFEKWVPLNDMTIGEAVDMVCEWWIAQD